MKQLDPKDLWALNRTILALVRTSISLIVLGFVVEKFDFFLKETLLHSSHKRLYLLWQSETFYHYLGLLTTFIGIILGIYTAFYYKKQLLLLKKGIVYDNESLFYAISFFVSGFGVLIFLGMIFL